MSSSDTQRVPNQREENPISGGISDKMRLTRAILELESYVHTDGWDGAPRLFALARSAELVSKEPQLAQALGLVDADGGETALVDDPDALVPIEQEWGSFDGPLDEALGQITWPEQVVGAAITMERVLLPESAEAEIDPDADTEAQLDFAMNHPERKDVRIGAAVLRSGEQECTIRIREEGAEDAEGAEGADDADDADDENVLTGRDLAPGLTEALMLTFE